MKISEHANYLLNEYGRLQFDYAAYCKPDGESLRNEARNNLETYIAELEATQRWIPVSERLPEKQKLTIGFTDNSAYVFFEIVNDDEMGLVMYPYQNRKGNVTHWMPLPESPIVYGKEREE